MTIASSSVLMPTGPLAGGAFPPGRVIHGYITIVNGVGSAAVIDHIEVPEAKANGMVVASFQPAISIASGETLTLPISLVVNAPQAQTLASQDPGATSRTFTCSPVIYTTDGQVVADDSGGNQSFYIAPFTWNTGGGG